MKKRIVCLILTVVMLALTLVGCGYSYLDDDLNKYASFDKAAFDQQIKNIVVKLGDGADEEDAAKRDADVWDAIYSSLASNPSDSTRKTAGKPASHDLFYYSYYYTFEKDNVTYQAKPEYMVLAKGKLQLGQNNYTDVLMKAIVAALGTDFEITADNLYSQDVSEDKVIEGSYATLTYTYTYVTKDENDQDKTVTATVTVKENIKANNLLHKALLDGNAEAEKAFAGEVQIPENSAFVLEGKEVNAAITIKDIKVGAVRSAVTEGKLASVTYSYSYTKTGETTATNGTIANSYQVISVDNLLHKALIGYEIGKEYSTTVTEKNDAGEDVEKTVKEIKIPANSGFVINGKEISEEITLSAIKVDYYVAGKTISDTAITPANDTATVTVEDVAGNKVADVSTQSLKYYVYPCGYTTVDEYNAFNIIDLVVGKSATSSNKTTIVTTLTNMVIYGLGIQFDVDVEDEEAYNAAVDTQKAKIAELFAVKGLSATESATVLDSLADKIAEAIIDHNAKSTAKTNANSAVTTARDEVAKAEASLGEASTDAEKQTAQAALDSANKTLTEKEEALAKAEADLELALLYKNALIASLLTKDYQAVTTAKAEYVKASADLDEKEAALKAAADDKKAEAEAAVTAAKTALEAKRDAFKALATPTSETATSMKTKLANGYHDFKYAESLATYRTEKQAAIIAEVYRLINAIEIKEDGGYPKKAVDEAYDYLMNKYKYTFYNENYMTTNEKGEATEFKDEEGNTVTNYTWFEGSFKNFLIAAMGIDTATTADPYQAAKDKVRAEAQADVAPVLKMYVVAKAYGLEFTDKEFKQYKKDNKDLYKEQEYTYGEDNVRTALQFNKLMDYFLASEEIKPDANYPLFKLDKYTNIQVVVTKK